MAINPDHLISFAHVARLGSVSAAAEALHRSQPAISAQLRQLTEQVGEPLYRRYRHGVTLTSAGEALLPHAQAVERSLAGARRLIGEIRSLERGQLAVSASMTIAVYLLPRLLARFSLAHPELDLQLLTRNSHEVLDLLGQGRVEVALVETPLDTALPGVERHHIFTDEVVLAATPQHPLARAGAVSPHDLHGLRVVNREPGSGTRRVAENALAEFGVEVTTVIETSGIEASKEAVLQGLGAGFISRLAIERELAAGLLEVIGIDGLRLDRPMTLLHPPPELCSRASQAFLHFLKSELG